MFWWKWMILGIISAIAICLGAWETIAEMASGSIVVAEVEEFNYILQATYQEIFANVYPWF